MLSYWWYELVDRSLHYPMGKIKTCYLTILILAEGWQRRYLHFLYLSAKANYYDSCNLTRSFCLLPKIIIFFFFGGGGGGGGGREGGQLQFRSAISLTLDVPCISESCTEIKLNFYFHTSLWCLKRFYEDL